VPEDHSHPDARWALPAHAGACALVQSTAWALQGVMPVLAIKRFHANEWQALLITATPVVFYSLSIFWNDLLKRSRFGHYLASFWLIASLPLAFVAFADTYWHLLVAHLVACVGGAGFPSINSEVLQSLYHPSRRGRMYSINWGLTAVATACFGFSLGAWLNADEEAFRLFLPIIAGLQGLGVLLFAWLSRVSGHAHTPAPGASGLARLVEPIVHMRAILKADPVFARYEAAYMTYGVGWMIAAALLPNLVTAKLELDYKQIAESTQVAYLAALVLALFPAGLLMDRMGAVRSTAISFFMLAAYPLALAFVSDRHQLLFVSVYFGLAHAGASVGWTVGPVSLAPSPDKATAYLAIHATFVGIRGKLFQGLGVLLYWATGDFTVPLLVAAAAYLWSGWQMRSLDRRMRVEKATATPPAGA